jgi:hypothetical protein
MDGRMLYRDLAAQINEDPDTSGALDPKSAYIYLWRSAIEIGRRLKFPRGEATVTTVADQRDGYLLPADFSCLYMRDSMDEFFVRYYNGSAYSNLRAKDEEAIFEDNITASRAMPGGFCITDYRTAISNVTGKATAEGDASGGQCTLTDSGASFSSAVNPGDTVHNVTDGSTGFVISVTSGTALVTALFGGTGNDWDVGDDSVIVPQGRLQFMFDAPPATSGHVVTVPYVKRPDPVFSYYGRYPFQTTLSFALVNYAAWLFKYRDSQPNQGDKWFRLFDRDVRQAAGTIKAATTPKRLKVVMKVR